MHDADQWVFRKNPKVLFGDAASSVCQKQLSLSQTLCLVKHAVWRCARRYARGMISGTGSTLFEELGLYYIGPLDGHNLDDLVAVLSGACCAMLYMFRLGDMQTLE